MFSRRSFLKTISTGVLTLGLQSCFFDVFPDKKPELLSKKAKLYIDQSWKNIDPKRMVDLHVHLLGLGNSGNGCWINPKMKSMWRLSQWVRFNVFLKAAGVDDKKKADEMYLNRLKSLVDSPYVKGKVVILALDFAYNENGTIDYKNTPFHVPDDYVFNVCKQKPDKFLFGASVHPYRKDAIKQLYKAKSNGAVLIKWLPNAQLIDPSSPKCTEFYKKLVELKLPLLCHTGEENAVATSKGHHLGNPLLIKRALDNGVKVIAAHCASSGSTVDNKDKKKKHNTDHFLKLLEQWGPTGLLFGDISALTQINRHEGLKKVLNAPHLLKYLCFGSDYPLPAIRPLFHPRVLEMRKFITSEEKVVMEELFKYNTFVFDFVLKRKLRQKKDGKTIKFLPENFMIPKGLISV